MGKSKQQDAAMELAHVRKNILTHCENLPQLIQTHGIGSLGWVALNIGKCFLWIGPTLDSYTITQPLPGAAPLPRVSDIGEQLRVIGLQIIEKPFAGDLNRTIAVLKTQLAMLNQLEKMEGGR